MIDPRRAFLEMEKTVSRRAFFGYALKGVAVGAGALAALDQFGPRLFGQAQTDAERYDLGLKVVSAFGQMVIPVDQDSGWATFEPDITTYALDVYIRQVFNLGVDLAFNGYLQAVASFNSLPPLIAYGPEFLSMDVPTRSQYLTDILIGNFENNGVQDILAFAGIFMLLATKMVFFQNFPHHIADPNSEFQNVLGNTPNTAWDMMKYRGPVLAAEEAALRAAAANAPELPGVDLRNPFI
ncbi:MAG TPA: hypothetical protein VHC72_20670 [Bryobacteraceae bacterium]|nr:hypothetical protein [Bryobacteraceae bacterium]